MHKDMIKSIDDYEKKVEAKEITKEKANAELKEKFKGLGLENMKTTCAKADVDTEYADFAKANAAAKKAYPGSETETKIKDAKKPKAGMPPKGDGDDDEDEGKGMGGGMDKPKKD